MKSDIDINISLLVTNDKNLYVFEDFQDASIYNKKVTREEVELFDQPS